MGIVGSSCLAALLLAVFPVAAATGKDAAALPVFAAAAVEENILELVNRERAAWGRRPLAPLPALAAIARRHSERMGQAGQLGHLMEGEPMPDAQLAAAGVFFSVLSENVAVSESWVPSFIHEAFVRSLSHRANLLDSRMTHAGIGVHPQGGKYWVTEEFAAIFAPEAPAGVAERLEAEIVRRYRERHGLPLAVAGAERLRARVLSQQYLMGIPIALPGGDAGMRGFSYAYHDLEAIAAEIRRELETPGYRSFAVGVAMGRNARSPGGTYAVSVLFYGAPRSGE